MTSQTQPNKRIAVVGCSGSGKTTLAKRISQELGLPHVELDSIHHQPGWVPLPAEEFRRQLDARLDDAAGWVVDGNYNKAVGDWLQSRADTIVWIDLPRHIVMRQVVFRTLRRFLTREELWNGNREPMSNLWCWDPERNVMRWAWTSFHRNRERYERRMTDGSWAHAKILRLTAADEVQRCVSLI